MRSDEQIKTDIYNVLKASALATSINGEILTFERSGDATSEDVTISVIANDDDGRTQSATAVVRIYVRDLKRGADYVADNARLRALADIAYPIVKRHNGGAFRWVVSRQSTYKVEQTNQHAKTFTLAYQSYNL